MTHHRLMHIHRGVSLTEMLVVMTACTVAFSLTGQLLCRVMRICTQAQHDAGVERSALRLSTQFRRDVHAAQSADVDLAAKGDVPFLLLHLPDGTDLAYSHRDGTIVRQRARADKIEAREEFAFPELIDVDVREEESPARVALTVTVERPAPATDASPKAVREPRNPISMQVEAILDRDRLATNLLSSAEAGE